MSNLPKIQVLKKRWQMVFGTVLVFLLKLYSKTLFVRPSKLACEWKKQSQKPAIFAFWHDNLLSIYKIKKLLPKSSKIAGLVSPSRDGAWLSYLFSKVGIDSVRGSSKRRGLSAISIMTDKLKNGSFIAITPDGPRGPSHVFKNGVAMTAQSAQCDVVLIAIHPSLYFTIPSWDKLKVPVPFSKIYTDIVTISFSEIKDLETVSITNLLQEKLLRLQKNLENEQE